MIIEKETIANKNNYKIVFDTKNNITIIERDKEIICQGEGLWQVFNTAVDIIKDNRIIEEIGIIVSDIDLEISM